MAAEPRLSDVMKKPAYARALTSLLDHAENLPGWTREVLKTKGAYRSGLAVPTDIDGMTYEKFYVCPDQHNCRDNKLAVMFAPNGTQAWVVLLQEGTVSYLGAPSDAQQAALKRAFVVPAPAKTTGPYFFDVIKKPAYARASISLLDHAGKLPSSIREVLRGKGSYNSEPAMPTVIDGTTYETFSICFTEFSCNNTSMVVMFAPNGTRAWGLLLQEGAMSYLGAPSDAQLQVMRGALEAYDAKWGQSWRAMQRSRSEQ
jgi:hypothetical protein